MIDARAGDLADYQDSAYAERYRSLTQRARQAEETQAGGLSGFALAVARFSYKLMAYKDEYEVARLYSSQGFTKRLNETFEGPFRLEFHFAPPLFSTRDPHTGLPAKQTYGPWMLRVLKLLTRLRALRGTPFDPFGYTKERRAERALITAYEQTIDELARSLDHDNHALAIEIASLADGIRGYGHVKQRHLQEVQVRQEKLLDHWRTHAPRAEAI